MGIFAALAAIATLHVASDAGVPRLVRAGAAGALPVIVPTLYLTLSRGGLAAAVVGVALYVLLAARWSLLGTFVVAGVPTALATLSAYNATALVTVHPRSPLAVHQGHGVARTVAIMIAIAFVAQLAIAFTPVDTRLPAVPRGARMPARVIAVVVAVVVGVAAGGPHFVSTKFHGLVHGNHIHTSADVRERLFNPANNGRLPLWRSALAAYRAAPVHGQGAGTFETWWHRHRKITDEAVHAHSI